MSILYKFTGVPYSFQDYLDYADRTSTPLDFSRSSLESGGYLKSILTLAAGTYERPMQEQRLPASALSAYVLELNQLRTAVNLAKGMGDIGLVARIDGHGLKAAQERLESLRLNPPGGQVLLARELPNLTAMLEFKRYM